MKTVVWLGLKAALTGAKVFVEVLRWVERVVVNQ